MEVSDVPIVIHHSPAAQPHHVGPHPLEVAGACPIRVKAAFEVLSVLSGKTAARAAANDLFIEVIPGQKLTTAESNLLATAANTLTSYLAGKMPADRDEKRLGRLVEEFADDMIDGPEIELVTGNVLWCPFCKDPQRPERDCRVCAGHGRVLVKPIVGEE